MFKISKKLLEMTPEERHIHLVAKYERLNKRNMKKKQTKETKKYEKVKKTSKLGSGKRFSALTKSLKSKGAKNPKALAAWIGRKKYGSKKMAKMSAAGKKS